MKSNEETRWIAEKLSSLEPDWTGRLAHGRVLLEAGEAPRSGRRWMLAMAAVLVLAVALPQTRAIAQDLWRRLMVRQVEVIQVDFSRYSPLQAELSASAWQADVEGLEQAESKAGYRPYLPPQSVLPDAASLKVVGPIAVRQSIRVGELESALRGAGAGDVRVPSEWEGIVLRAEVGPMVMAGYAGEIQVLQLRPFELFVPSGFALEQFATAILRSAGVPPAAAAATGARLAANPALFLNIPGDEVARVEQITLANGPGWLIEDFDERGATSRVSIVYNTKERIYVVSSPSRETSKRVANSLP